MAKGLIDIILNNTNLPHEIQKSISYEVDELNEDMDSIGNFTRFSKDKTKVLEAIVNLYLKKQIIFE